MRLAPDAGVRALFLAYFSFAGLFAPWLGIWLDARGMSIVQIGLLLAVPQWMRIIGPPLWAAWADRSHRGVRLLRWGAAGALGAVLLLSLTHSVLEVALVLVLLCFMTAGQMPIGEAMAVRQVQGDPGGYGRIRIWGSVGYIATVIGGGILLDRLGLQAWPVLMVLALLALLMVTLAMREQPAPARAAPAAIGARLREPAVLAFLVSVFCMIFAHGALYGFWSLYLERHGYSRTAIGAIWALGVIAEILLFALQRRLFERFSAVTLLGFSLCIGVLRFAWVGATDAERVVVIASSLMHAITFGLHHSASMAVLHRLFPPEQQARAQAAFIVVGYGLGAGLGGVWAGLLWEHVSPAAVWWAAATACGLGAIAVRWHARIMRRTEWGDRRISRSSDTIS